MKIFILLILFSSKSYAGFFSVSTYEGCIDEVVKNVKIKEALYEGQSNCYEKYIRPKQDRMQSKAWQSSLKSATKEEISKLRCISDGKIQNFFVIKCSFSDLPMSNYGIIRLNATLKDGSTKELEFKNYAPDLKWKNDPLSSFVEIEVDKINRNSLQVKYVK